MERREACSFILFVWVFINLLILTIVFGVLNYSRLSCITFITMVIWTATSPVLIQWAANKDREDYNESIKN